jgi:hypothetical protein
MFGRDRHHMSIFISPFEQNEPWTIIPMLVSILDFSPIPSLTIMVRDNPAGFNHPDPPEVEI